jgi:hypothetical protein
MTEAKNISDRLESVLRDTNVSALKSYLEAKPGASPWGLYFA